MSKTITSAREKNRRGQTKRDGVFQGSMSLYRFQLFLTFRSVDACGDLNML